MNWKKTLTLMLGACLASSVASAAPDFSQQMADLAVANVLGDFPFAFLDPLTADLNENGVLDAKEFALLEAQMDGAFSYSADVNTAYNANVAAVTAHMNATVAGVLGANTDKLKSVLAGYMTLGGERQFNILNTVLTGVNMFLSTLPTHTPGAFDQSQSAFCGPCGDADGDGVKNLNEALAAGSEGAYVAAALDNGTTTSGADTLGGCIFKFDANPGGNSRHWFFNPANGNVYFVGSDYQGNLLPSVTATSQYGTFASTLSVNGLLIENGHPLKIDDAAENTFIAGLRASGSYWMGASDVTTEGQWRWYDNVQFWQGAAAGTAVGGAFTNWNGGEPNDSGGEDYAEVQMPSGGWNDNGFNDLKPVIVEIEGDFTDVSPADGIPDQWTDNNNDGLPDGLSVGSVTITPNGSTTIKETFTVELGASSEPGDIYTWTSSNPSIATVETNGAAVDVTGVSPGTVTISVEVTDVAKGLGAIGSIQITVIEAQWFDLCGEVATFEAQMAILAGVGLDAEDQELGVGDGVPDAWQLYLLAYAVCGDSPEAAAAYNANLALMPGLVSNLTNNYVPFVLALYSQLDEIEALAVKFETNPCDAALAGLGVPSLAAALHDIAGAGGDLALLSQAPGIIAGTANALAGLATTSTEMSLTLQGGLDDVLRDDLGLALQVLAAIAGNLGGCPDGVAADAGAILGVTGLSVPSIAWPAWVAFDDPGKTATEPLAGAGDYNGDTMTNEQVAGFVIQEGGDENDFLAGATGDFGPFWQGNPALPLGTVVLGGLMGAFAVAGVAAIRRRRK